MEAEIKEILNKLEEKKDDGTIQTNGGFEDPGGNPVGH